MNNLFVYANSLSYIFFRDHKLADLVFPKKKKKSWFRPIGITGVTYRKKKVKRDTRICRELKENVLLLILLLVFNIG